MRILLVEDDSLLASGLSAALRHSGYVVDWSARGDDAYRWLCAEEFDLVILDIGLPGMSGSDMLKKMRKQEVLTPVLILSAREGLNERVGLLDLGADDYLVKPVALAELEARVRVLLRRGTKTGGRYLEFGPLSLDQGGKRVYVNGVAQDYSSREWHLLEILVTRADRIVSKEQLLQLLFGWEESASLNAIEKSISRLRAKLEPVGIDIRTVRGLGYVLAKAA